MIQSFHFCGQPNFDFHFENAFWFLVKNFSRNPNLFTLVVLNLGSWYPLKGSKLCSGEVLPNANPVYQNSCPECDSKKIEVSKLNISEKKILADLWVSQFETLPLLEVEAAGVSVAFHILVWKLVLGSFSYQNKIFKSPSPHRCSHL